MDLLSRKITKEYAYELPKEVDGTVFISAVSNIMFQTMFNNTERKKYVSYLLSLILEKDYEEILNNIEFSKDVLDKKKYYNKGETVDLIVKVNDIFYNVEMNNNKTVENMERNIDYINNIYGERARLGGKYQYNNCLQININNFNFEGNKEIIQEFEYRNKSGLELTNKIKIIYIYLPLIREKYYNKSELNELEKFLLVINEEKEGKIREFMKEGRIMEEYRLDAESTSRDTKVVGLYNKEQEDEFLLKATMQRLEKENYKKGLEKGIQQGIDIGKAEGKAEGKLEIIKSMIQDKVDDSTIMRYVKISSKELEKIKSEM